MLKADEDGRVWLENLSKTNPGGTLLNNEMLAQTKMLMDCDEISICGRRFRFEYAEVEEQEASMEDATVAIPSLAASAVAASTLENANAAMEAVAEEAEAAPEVETVAEAAPAKNKTATPAKLPAKSPKSAKKSTGRGDKDDAMKENDANESGQGARRTPNAVGRASSGNTTGNFEREVLSALKARRSLIQGDESLPASPNASAVGAMVPSGAFSGSAKKTKSERRKSGLCSERKAPPNTPADALNEAEPMPQRPPVGLPSEILAAIAARAKASPGSGPPPSSVSKGSAKKAFGSAGKRGSRKMSGVFAGLGEAMEKRASSIAQMLQNHGKANAEDDDDEDATCAFAAPVVPSPAKAAAAPPALPTPLRKQIAAKRRSSVASAVEPVVAMEEDLGEVVEEKASTVAVAPAAPLVVAVSSLPADLSVRAALPTPLRKQIALKRRKSSVGSNASVAAPLSAALTPAKQAATPNAQADADVEVVGAFEAGLSAGLRSALKSAKKRLSAGSSAGAPGSVQKPSPSPSKLRVSFGAGVKQGTPMANGRFHAAVAPPNTPAEGLSALPMNMPMPVTLEGVSFTRDNVFDDVDNEEEEADTAEEQPAPKKRAGHGVKFLAASAADFDGSTSAGEAHSERKRKAIRPSWDQTPGHKEGERRRSSKTPKAKLQKTPATAGGAADTEDVEEKTPVGAVAPTSVGAAPPSATLSSSKALASKASASKASASKSSAAGSVTKSDGLSTGGAMRGVAGCMESLESVDANGLTPCALAVQSGLMGDEERDLPQQLEEEINDNFNPDAASIVGNLLKRPSMGVPGVTAAPRSSMEGCFSPMRAVEKEGSGEILALGTFAVRPSPKSANAKSTGKSKKSAAGRRSSISSLVPDAAATAAVVTTDDILAAAAEQMSDELPAARAFVSPQPKGGRTNAHVRFGPNATPRVQKIAEGGLWIASVGYAADGSASLTLLDKASDAAEWDEAGEWTEEEWASWEVDQYASWEETHAEAWEAENGCYPWQFEEAAEAKGTPQPPGGRVNSHVRFGDDADEEEAIEDEEEAMEYDYDYGDGIDEDEEEVEAFGEVGVLSTVKGAAPTPVATFNGGESLDAALGSATPFVPGSGMRQMRIRTRESHASRATSASEVSRGLASIAKSYADADEAEEEMEQEKMGESDAEEVELADDDEDDDGDLPVQKLFGTPIPEAMEEAVTLAGTFAVSTEPSTEAVVTTNCATPAKTPKSSTKGAAKTPKSGRKSGNGREEGLPTLGSLSKSAGKSAGLRSGAKCPPPLENGEQLVRGTFTPLVLHEPTDVASGASSRRLVGIFTPAEEDAEMQSVFPLGMSARKGDKGKSSSSRLPAAADTEDEPKAKCASELTLFEVMSANKNAQRGAVAGYLASVDDAEAIEAVEESLGAAQAAEEQEEPMANPNDAMTPASCKSVRLLSSAQAPKSVVLHRECTGDELAAVFAAVASTPTGQASALATAVPRTREYGEATPASCNKPPASNKPSASNKRLSTASSNDPLSIAEALTLSEDLQEMLEPGSVKKAARPTPKPEAATPEKEESSETLPSSSQESSVASAEPAWSEADVALMKVAELKEALESLGLETDGKKAVLAARLIEALKSSVPMQQSEAVAPAAAVEEVTAPGAPAADALASAPPAWSEEEVGAMKVAELKVALESLGLETDGKKAVLATRLIEALKASVPEAEKPPAAAVEEEVQEEAPKRRTKRGMAETEPAEQAPPTRAKRSKETEEAPPVEEAPKRRPKRGQPEPEAAPPSRVSRSRR